MTFNFIICVLLTMCKFIIGYVLISFILNPESHKAHAVLHIDFTKDDGTFLKLELLDDLDNIKDKKRINVKIDYVK